MLGGSEDPQAVTALGWRGDTFHLLVESREEIRRMQNMENVIVVSPSRWDRGGANLAYPLGKGSRHDRRETPHLWGHTKITLPLFPINLKKTEIFLKMTSPCRFHFYKDVHNFEGWQNNKWCVWTL
jgi:hypothetical protein